ncbi:MAG: diaminopimelate epimerase [bacterium]|nr:diaminopimelate epimerase [bacterium]
MPEFYKYHGAGNDFVIINNLAGKISLTKDQVVAVCDRHYGIGADGVILVESSKFSDCYMNYYNSDGSQGLCGNGTRCTAKFLQDNLFRDKKSFRIDTISGTKNVVSKNDGTFSVNMGKPAFSNVDFPARSMKLEDLSFNFVSVGNPHAIAFVENLDDYDLPLIGPKVENNPIFPNKINVELVQEKSPSEFQVKVWERGSGVTLACGTGACAVYAVVQKLKKAEPNLTIELPGGKLFFSQNEAGETLMRGPAVFVFKGEINNFYQNSRDVKRQNHRSSER